MYLEPRSFIKTLCYVITASFVVCNTFAMLKLAEEFSGALQKWKKNIWIHSTPPPPRWQSLLVNLVNSEYRKWWDCPHLKNDVALTVTFSRQVTSSCPANYDCCLCEVKAQDTETISIWFLFTKPDGRSENTHMNNFCNGHTVCVFGKHWHTMSSCQ